MYLRLFIIILFSISVTYSKRTKGLLIIDPFIDFIHEVVLKICDEKNIEVFEAVCGYTDAILTSSGDNRYNRFLNPITYT